MRPGSRIVNQVNSKEARLNRAFLPSTTPIDDPNLLKNPGPKNARPVTRPPRLVPGEQAPRQFKASKYKFRDPGGLPTCLCLRRSTLTGRGTPFASREPWRVASPITTAKHEGGFINSMWNDIPMDELKELMDEITPS